MKPARQFLQNAYYHCLHYTVNKKLHWVERFFWGFFVILSLCGLLYVIKESFYEFYATKASLTVRTDYLNFKTPFPSIFFCEYKEIDGKIPAMLENLNTSINTDKEVFVRELTFIRPTDFKPSLFAACGSAKFLTNPEACDFIDSYKKNLTVFSDYIRASCEEIFTSCFYNNKEIKCCDEFIKVNTFEGACYAINNFYGQREKHRMQIKRDRSYKNMIELTPSPTSDYLLEHKSSLNPANLSIELAHANLHVWYVSYGDMPTKMFQKFNQINLIDIIYGTESRILNVHLRVQEILSDTSLYTLGLRRRNCKFWFENENLRSFLHYTTSACEIDCLRRAQLFYCKCVLHTLPNEKELNDRVCDLNGLECIANSADILNNIALNCSCINTCYNLEVSQVGIEIPRNNKDVRFRDPRSIKRINFLVRAPTLQYNRYASKEPFDFIGTLKYNISKIELNILKNKEDMWVQSADLYKNIALKKNCIFLYASVTDLLEYNIPNFEISILINNEFEINISDSKVDTSPQSQIKISIGGAMGLFVGCSFLILGQIFYYFILKPVDDYLINKKVF